MLATNLYKSRITGKERKVCGEGLFGQHMLEFAELLEEISYEVPLDRPDIASILWPIAGILKEFGSHMELNPIGNYDD